MSRQVVIKFLAFWLLTQLTGCCLRSAVLSEAQAYTDRDFSYQEIYTDFSTVLFHDGSYSGVGEDFRYVLSDSLFEFDVRSGDVRFYGLYPGKFDGLLAGFVRIEWANKTMGLIPESRVPARVYGDRIHKLTPVTQDNKSSGIVIYTKKRVLRGGNPTEWIEWDRGLGKPPIRHMFGRCFRAGSYYFIVQDRYLVFSGTMNDPAGSERFYSIDLSNLFPGWHMEE